MHAAVHVDAFLPVSRYYFDYMPRYLGVPAVEDARGAARDQSRGLHAPPRTIAPDVFTVGFFARVAPEKGLHVLARWLSTVSCALGDERGAGWSSPATWRPNTRRISTASRSRLDAAGLAAEFEYRGELDRAGKIDFLQSLDVMSVPATYDEPKGMFLLEAMAVGVPVVQPRRGAFPEILETTGGGILVDRDDPEALAEGLECGKIERSPPALGAAAASRRARALHSGSHGRDRRADLPRDDQSSTDRGGVARSTLRETRHAHREEHHEVVSDAARRTADLNGISLTLNRGDRIAITGPSGSGKSTLLYILGALEPPTSGSITLDGVRPL